MNLWRISCSSLVLVCLALSYSEAGYTKPVLQQWPWSSYTTTTASPGSDSVVVSTESTTSPPPPPELNIDFSSPANFAGSGNNNNENFVVLTNPQTNQEYFVPRQAILERGAGQNFPQQQTLSANVGSAQPTVRCGHYFARFCREQQLIQQQQQQQNVRNGDEMETAASTYPFRFPVDNNRVYENYEGTFGDNELYSYNQVYNNYYRSHNVYPLIGNHDQQIKNNLLRLVFRQFDPDTAIYSYASVAPQNTNENTEYSRRDRPTIRPRLPKLTSTWRPIIYRTSTQATTSQSTSEADDPVTTPTTPESSTIVDDEVAHTTDTIDEVASSESYEIDHGGPTSQ